MKKSSNYFSMDFFKSTFYPFVELDSEQVKKSVKFLENAIIHIIKEYDDHMANNVFKHGFYGSSTSDVSLSMENNLIGISPNMMEWYEIHPFEDHHRLHYFSKSISAQREFNIIKLCSSIIQQFFKIKRIIINKETSATMSLFLDIPLNKIFSVYEYGATLGNLNFQYEITLPDNFLK